VETNIFFSQVERRICLVSIDAYLILKAAVMAKTMHEIVRSVIFILIIFIRNLNNFAFYSDS